MASVKQFKTIPEMFLTLTQEFGKGLERAALREKVDGKYKDISYQTVYNETESFALGLASMGVKRGDKVAIIAENRPEWVYSDMGILGIGAVDVPLYPIITSDTIEYSLNDSASAGIVVSNNFQLNKVLKVRDNCKTLKFIVVMNDMDVSEHESVYTFQQFQELGQKFKAENDKYFVDHCNLAMEEEVCTIIYTSGTTGEPKGVILTHQNILSNVLGAHKVFDINKDDIFLSFLPLCHIFERMAGYYLAFSSGAIICYAESIDKVASNLIEVKPTVMTAVPRLFERIYSKIQKKIDAEPEKKQKIFKWAVEVGRQFAAARKTQDGVPLGLKMKQKAADKLVFQKLRASTGGRLRFFVSGGAALARELGEFFEAVGILIVEGYGLTESSPVIAVNRVNDYKFGTVGKVLPGVEVKIAQDGEILASGPNIMQGYFNKKKETEEVIKNGWLHTGDIGVFDAEGFLIITDRKKHLFKTSGGKYIAPTPIENLFLASKFIEQFVLIGDRRMFLTALIVPDMEAVQEYADAHRISYTDPRELVNTKQIYELLEKELGEFQRKLANYERVRKFTILDTPFSIEGGEMTPSLKIKRKVVEERYANLIDDMYKGLEKK